ncbi:hypothetical protein Pst134EB_027350 [Puccinia striiformis f. sp. tritici]|uniref:DNA polymerase epsilon catalytic subunit n=1 Tax=Puccinia striiformis f. sp. tritici PST-78 TaxID=1165861 RepID=A0A0L0W3T8_9BASI|nr:hypothetical protein Pst134EB_027350 [Puccinia striiformis f. sp. tritici]KNF06132.1 hypothetical protein PSTG_00642 [Puccinia striiformis f. sp. tritici PST-78]
MAPFKSRGRGGSYTKFRGRGGGGGGGFRPGGGRGAGAAGKVHRTADGLVIENEKDREGTESQEKWNRAQQDREIDESLGFVRFDQGHPRVGWLINIQPTLVQEALGPTTDKAEGSSQPSAAVDLYFLQEDGNTFRSTMVYHPYFFIASRVGKEAEVEEWIRKKYDGQVIKVEGVIKEDLKLPNHLAGHRRRFLKLIFRNVEELLRVRRELLAIATSNHSKMDALDSYAEVVKAGRSEFDGMDIEDFDANHFDSIDPGPSISHKTKHRNLVSKSNTVLPNPTSPSEWIVDIREYDIPYYLRVSIDKNLRVGLWYNVSIDQNNLICTNIPDRVERAEPVVMAYDIETTKPPLKFPDSANDQIMMISYMIDGQGFLITNREIVADDIADFDYTPKPEYEGQFTIFNEENEMALIRRWFDHIRDARPTVMATYNGDAFDFPFVYARAAIHGLDMFKEIGFNPDSESEFRSRTCIHMDCFKWVKRDSYLPQGSQGLKAVTVAKLGYNPIELDPELMTPYAVEQPQTLAQYSVSDAVATYYLYMKYVHPFIFSLCNIIPLNPDEVLRKGSGTLCETLLMVEAFNSGIIMPNRHTDPHGTMYNGHLLESETYVGGHVEALEAGVFRSDILSDFKLVPSRCQKLIDELDSALKFAIVDEGQHALEDVLNYDEVRAAIQDSLETMRDVPDRQEFPLIYHLDVAAMYPNIMLSNRLQPDSVVSEGMCAACDFNRPNKKCARPLEWSWRGEYFPAKLDEYKMIRNAIESEVFPPKKPGLPPRKFGDLAPAEQTTLLHKRLGDYSRKVYRKTHETRIEVKEAIICQQENPFYIDTVRAFRDRRYTYKGLHKTWKKKADQAQQEGGSVGEIAEAKKMIVIYDSLQLAHKCILNSFYGYVMRKGARWHSMEMAGITCLTGAKIIQAAREIIDEVGRPLELDTDGIWCMLPKIFPDNYTFKLANGKTYPINYPCSILNHLVHQRFTNDQYHQLNPETKTYDVRSENSIFFELDGPYRAMILPSSKEEDKLLKKRYAVFNPDGSLAELKGFEVKRRGELQLIKIFQTAIFEKFLLGDDLKACYDAVAQVANRWLDVLASKAVSMHDEELIELISENRSMSKTLAEYGAQKSTSIRTAKRLSEFLGNQMVKDKGLSCRFIISAKPHGAPVTDRAVPVAIFSAEPSVQRHFLRKWLKDNSLVDLSLRSILDWGYYTERLGSVIQKLITIPAAMQKVLNPVPRIHHPDWLARRLATREDTFKQHKIDEMFARQAPLSAEELEALRASKQRKADALARKEPPKLPPPPKPSIHVDYSGWIAAMKHVWRAQRTAKKATSGSNFVPGSIASMLHVQSFKAASHSSHLELIQLLPNLLKPGEFQGWVLFNDFIQTVRIVVLREFYVNLKHEPGPDFFPESCVVEPVIKTLPRSQVRLNLFKISVPEKSYIEDAAHYQKMATSPEIEGVYERQLPLLQRALIRLGATSSLSSHSRLSLVDGVDKGFELSDLISLEYRVSQRQYLDHGKAVRYVLAYHFQSGSRHAVGIFNPNGAAQIFITDRSPVPQVPNLQKYYKNVFTARAQHINNGAGVFEYDPNMPVEVTNVASEALALKALSRELALLKGQKTGPGYVLVIHSMRDLSYYQEKVLSISKYPAIMIHSSHADNKFEAFGWQRFAAERMVQHFFRASSFLCERVIQAEQFNVPVGNFEADASRNLMDLEFARKLNRADHLLWWSPSQKPDLGSKEDDLNSELVMDVLSNPEISVMGAYSDASVELTIGDLAINSVSQSSWVYEISGTGGSLGFQNASHTLDEYAKGSVASSVLGDSDLPVQTFTLFRSMVRGWLAECARFPTSHYSGLIKHFWRWLSSSSSCMFDPALYRFVHGLMKKVFSQLLAEFRRLGTRIIFADFGRIFLLTTKPNSASALAYASYIVTAINGRDLFKMLDLNIVRFWEQLLWIDATNFAGITCGDPEQAHNPDAVENIDMNWNMVQFLPPALQQDFLRVVCLYVHDLYQCHNQANSSNQVQLEVDRKQVEAELLRSLVNSKITRQTLQIVNQIIKRQNNAAADPELRAAFDFPRLPGSHIAMKKPVLEFIKMVCFVMELATFVTSEVRIMKRVLLDLIGVREFSNEAVFKNPCIPFKIPDTICQHCSAVRSFDLSRDPDLLASASSRRVGQPPEWLCGHCGHPYDRLGIEAMLIEQLHKQVASFQLQDLRCSRCSQLKEDTMSLRCPCSGEYLLAGDAGSQTDRPSTAHLKRRLAVARSVAEAHQLDVLLEFVEWLNSQIS